MTETTVITRIRSAITDAVQAHQVMWDALERIAPDPDPHLHWEPTASGWRLYGHLAPPCDIPRPG